MSTYTGQRLQLKDALRSLFGSRKSAYLYLPFFLSLTYPYSYLYPLRFPELTLFSLPGITSTQCRPHSFRETNPCSGILWYLSSHVSSLLFSDSNPTLFVPGNITMSRDIRIFTYGFLSLVCCLWSLYWHIVRLGIILEIFHINWYLMNCRQTLIVLSLLTI